MGPRMNWLLARDAETSVRQPTQLGFPLVLPDYLDPELCFGAGGGDERPRLSGELHPKLDFNDVGSIRDVAKNARHGNRRRLDRPERRFESIGDRLDHLGRMQSTCHRQPGLLFNFHLHGAAAFQLKGDQALHDVHPDLCRALTLLTFLVIWHLRF
jgi:hypothetical protein